MTKFSIFFLSLLFVLTSCTNIFAPASNKKSDEAYYEEALKAMDSSDWTTALTNFGLISASFLDNREVKRNYAGALAGKCGLDFITYMNSLQNASIGGGTTMFKYLMNAFTDATIYPTYCTSAEAIINSISTDPTARTAGENLFMLILSMAKMGAYLRDNADLDGANNLGDGTTDGTFNACTVGTAAGEMSDTEVAEMVTGFAGFLINFAVAGAQFSSVSSTVTDLTTACTGLNLTFCSKTDATQVTAAEIKAMRSLIATDSTNASLAIGIGTCVDPTVVGCCP